MAKDIESGKLKLLSPDEVMAETLLMLENTNVIEEMRIQEQPCIELRIAQR